jgi:hypothetical protein
LGHVARKGYNYTKNKIVIGARRSPGPDGPATYFFLTNTNT